MFRRLVVLAIVALLACQPALAMGPAVRDAVVNVQGWSFQSSSIDLYFARNAGSCTVARILVPCQSLLSTTRASNAYEQWADGHFTSVGSNVARITDLGLLSENAATNLTLWSNDLTQSGTWVSVNTTEAKDQVGPDQAANSASSVTASANSGTVLQTFTGTSSSRTLSVYLRRITGTGSITLTENGLTGTACTLATATYTQCVLTASVLNPTIGLIFATSGDKVAVWGMQLEATTYATSPVTTTTVSATRAADVISLAALALIAALNSQAAFLETNNSTYVSGAPPRVVSFNSAQAMEFNATTTLYRTTNNTNNADATLGSGTSAGLVKMASGYDAVSITGVANGGTLATAANAWGAMTGPVVLGNIAAGTRAVGGYLMRVAFSRTKGVFNGMTN